MAEADGVKIVKKKQSLTCEGRCRSSYYDVEDIEFHPPVDQIPDEFPRETNENILVEMVYGKQDEEGGELQEVLENLKYNVNSTDRDENHMNTKVSGQWLSNVVEKAKWTKIDGLIMIFIKVTYDCEHMKDIWCQFTSKNCPELKNKPKIFIFQILKKGFESDNTATTLQWGASYETPAEADILVVQDKYAATRKPGDADFIDVLTSNIELYGYKEDIITLITIGFGLRYRPLVMSTMTRKFFFMLHEHRGHHYDYFETLEKIKRQIEQIKTEDKKVKKKHRSSFREFFRYTFNSPDKEHKKSIANASKELQNSSQTAPSTSGKSTTGTLKRDSSIKLVGKKTPLTSPRQSKKLPNSTSQKESKPIPEPVQNGTDSVQSTSNSETPANFAVPKEVKKRNVSTSSAATNRKNSTTRNSTVSNSSIGSKQSLDKKPAWK